MAMRLLEKDTREKQETLQALRQQLDQVKTLNLQMFHKTQVTHTDRYTRTHTHTLSLTQQHPREYTPLDRMCVQDCEREAQRKQEEEGQLEEKMNQMETTIKEMEQRFVWTCLTRSPYKNSKQTQFDQPGDILLIPTMSIAISRGFSVKVRIRFGIMN